MRASWVFLLGFVAHIGAGVASCPVGETAYLGPESGYVRDSASGQCVRQCEAGMTRLVTSNGYRFDLFAEKRTTPSINIRYGDTVCYADLHPGNVSGTLNIRHGTQEYHADLTRHELCPLSYTLSYDCGDGATGTPPDDITIEYGALFTSPRHAGTCHRTGYYLSGWKIGSEFKQLGSYYNYTYDQDVTMVAQWSAIEYVAPYFCNYCDEDSYSVGTAKVALPLL